jgi:hypothetical protein
MIALLADTAPPNPIDISPMVSQIMDAVNNAFVQALPILAVLFVGWLTLEVLQNVLGVGGKPEGFDAGDLYSDEAHGRDLERNHEAFIEDGSDFEGQVDGDTWPSYDEAWNDSERLAGPGGRW